MTSLPVIRLRPKTKPQAIRHGFPWVFADEVVTDRRTRAIQPGSFAVLEDPERKPLALVTVNPNSKIIGRVMDADPDAQIWINHPGEVIHSGYGRPSYWGGSGTMPLHSRWPMLEASVRTCRLSPSRASA